jgi:hypothetical protein
MQKILAIDVGIKNLSYCYIDTSPKIIKWETICVTDENCKKIPLDRLTDALLDTLFKYFDDSFEADVVLIENQPMLMNGNMKSVAVIIYTYFNMMRKKTGNIGQVKFIAASNKLKCKKAIDLNTETYKDRKKASVDLARLYIVELFPDHLEWFDKQKKADDASDSFNFAIYYMEKVLELTLC